MATDLKIHPDHLRRQAVVHVRQSTLHQVRGHRESTVRQYALADRAEIGAGQVGVVLALEAARLARSSVDWQRLVEICVVTRTLLADESAE